MSGREQAFQIKEEARLERLAALNLMEDALLARRETERANEALRESEAKLAVELADTQQLQRISSSLIEENDVDALYLRILHAARAVMRSDCASLQCLVPERNELLLLAHLGFAAESAEHWRWVSINEKTSCGLAMSTAGRVIIPDAERWELLAGTEDLAHYRRSGIRAVQSTRLVSRSGRLVGMISTHWRRPREPSERELRLFDVLARQTADLIERHAAQEALRAGEAKYRELFDSIDQGFCTIQLLLDEDEQPVDYRFLAVNPAYGRLTGLSHVVGRTVQEVLPSQSAEWLATYSNIALTGESRRFERSAEGIDRTFEIFAWRVGEPGERRVGILLNDISERKRAEAARRASEERLRSALAISTVGVLFWRETSVLVDVNDAFLKMSGFTREEALGKTWRDLTPPEFHDISQAAMDELRRRGESTPFEKQYLRKDGSRWWGLFTARMVGDEVAEFAINISDRRAAEETVRQSEQRLRTLADAVPQIIWTNTGDGVADYFNQRWYEYSGLNFEESAGPGWQAIVHPEDAPRSVPVWERALAAGTVFDTEYRLRRADGEYRWFIGRNVPMRDAEGCVTGWFGTATDIHDLKEAEAALRGSEEQFRRAIEDAPIPVIMHAEDGQVLQISKTWTNLTGYEASEVSRFDVWLNHAYGAGANEVLAHLRQLFEGEVSVLNTEIGVTTRTGERRCWAFSASAPGTLRDGRRFIVGMALDITERRAIEAELRQSQAQLQLAQEAGQVGIWDWDLASGESYWSATLWSLFGYDEPPLISPRTAWKRQVNRDDRRRVQASLADLLASRARDFRDEFQIERLDGETRWLESVARVARDAAGEAVSMSGVNFDVTERKRSEAALSASEERLRLVVENARGYAIFSLALDRTILSWNSGAEAILGYSRQEAIGQSGDIIFTAEDRLAGAPELEAETAFMEDRAADERWHLRKHGDLFWASGLMMAMRDLEGTVIGFVKIFRDETAARAAREALEQSRRELWAAVQENEVARAEAERARAEAEAAGAAKDHFLAVLSHELRTPLTPIAMATQSLARRKDLPDTVREALVMIRRNILLESRLVDDLLDVTKIVRGKMELLLGPVEMHDVIQHAVETTRSDLEERKQRLTLQLAAPLHLLQGDAARLQQVVWNLLKNASKFTPEGGQIHICTRNEKGRLLVEVADTGIGIDAEALPRIFDAFTQASVLITRQFGGLGLGLAIANAIVIAHNGELRVASQGLGRGATFTVSLPIATQG